MSKRLLILGGGRYYRRAIRSAQEMGCDVIVIDRDPRAPGFENADHHEVVDITDLPGALRVATRYAIDGVLALNDFGVRTAAAVAAARGLPGISCQAADYATNKAWMRRQWAEAGVPSARFKAVRTLGEARAAVAELGAWPLVVKPADSRGGGSRGVSKVENGDALAAAVTFAQSYYDDPTVIVEEYLDGLEHSLETLTVNGQTHVLAISDKEKMAPPYRVDKSVNYPTVLNGPAARALEAAAGAAVRALGITWGAAHVELCSTAEGPKLFELGARCGGGGTPDPIVPFATGIDMFKEVVRLALGETPHCVSPRWTRGCVFRFLTPPPGVIRCVSGVDEVRTWPGVLDADVFVEPGQAVRPIATGGDRPGFVIAGGATRAEAVALADRAEHHIRFEYEPIGG